MLNRHSLCRAYLDCGCKVSTFKAINQHFPSDFLNIFFKKSRDIQDIIHICRTDRFGKKICIFAEWI